LDFVEISGCVSRPFRSLNPRQRIKHIIAEPLVVHKVASRKEISARVYELMETVGLASIRLSSTPMSSAGTKAEDCHCKGPRNEPKAILLDEPVSALDVSIKAQILNLLRDLQSKFYLTYLIISHDLAVVEHISTRIGVMYLGKLVELAPRDELYGNPLHPYTRALLDSVPVADPTVIREASIEGEVPSPLNPPEGCHFHSRCHECESKCSALDPSMREITPDHYVACHLI
jgi:oligopeptide/dipeptide ABC transporter ATP-binding protein